MLLSIVTTTPKVIVVLNSKTVDEFCCFWTLHKGNDTRCTISLFTFLYSVLGDSSMLWQIATVHFLCYTVFPFRDVANWFTHSLVDGFWCLVIINNTATDILVQVFECTKACSSVCTQQYNFCVLEIHMFNLDRYRWMVSQSEGQTSTRTNNVCVPATSHPANSCYWGSF